MISAIKLNNCTPYQQEEVSDCKKINFIYGANGCGKTTISSFLAAPQSPRFAQSSIEWDGEAHETICVYNRGFRSSNFKQIIPGVFTLGSATIEDINALEQMKKDHVLKKEDWEKKSESYRKQTTEVIPARESKFKEDAWTQILKANETDFQKAFEGLRASKDRFLAELKRRIAGVPGHEGSICIRPDLLSRAKTLYAGKPERCGRFELNIKCWLDKIEEIRTDPIWDTVIAGNRDVDIAALIEELKNSPWVDKGRQYIRPGSMTCPFCQQDTITDGFREKLESFFDTKYKQRIERMQALLGSYRDAADHIITGIEEVAHDEVAVNIGKLDTEIYFAKENLLSSMYSDHEQKIEDKIKEPGKKIAIADASTAVQEIVGLLDAANEKIDAHNVLVDKRETEIEKLTDDVWATVINEADSLIKTYQTEIDNLNKAANGIKRARDSKKREVEQLEADIIEKGKNITSVQPTIDEINRSLRAYGFTNFSIQSSDEEPNCYCIKREDGEPAIGTLSEGEETFLSFLYFMQWTKGSTDPEQVSDKKIIVLDDPISSLDSTILYIVGAMVKDLSRKIRDEQGDVSQLFVLTHNVFFHKEASFDPRQSMGNNINFWVIRKDNDISTVSNYGQNNPISTSYELLWSELRENQNITQVSIQNAMRRIIENYFGMLGKGKDETLLSNFETAEEQMIARSLLFWINDGSHSIPDDLYIDSFTDAVPKYRTVFKEIFRASGHIAHYNMMMRIEDRPEADVGTDATSTVIESNAMS